MSMIWTRRQTLKAAGAGAAAALGHGRMWAASKTLNILSHRVHQACLTEGPAGDQLGAWRKAQDAEAVYATFDSNPLHQEPFGPSVRCSRPGDAAHVDAIEFNSQHQGIGRRVKGNFVKENAAMEVRAEAGKRG